MLNTMLGMGREAAARGTAPGLAAFRPAQLRVLWRQIWSHPARPFRCLNHHRRGTCNNNRTIARARIEERVLSGLKDRLVCAESVAEAVRAYAEEMNRLNRDRRAQAQADRKVLEKIERSIAGIIAAIEDGMYQPVMKARGGAGAAEGRDHGPHG